MNEKEERTVGEQTKLIDATRNRKTERQMVADHSNSVFFNQTLRSGGEEMTAVFFTAAAID